jgi:hypothetical protein
MFSFFPVLPVLFRHGKVTADLPVCYELSEKNRDREVEGLNRAMLTLEIKKRYHSYL